MISRLNMVNLLFSNNAFLVFEGCVGKILAIRKGGQFVDSITSGDEGAILLDKTNFYAEQGGQIYDTGVLTRVGDEVRTF